MAKPQVENGHTRIANELLEQLAFLHLSPNQWQVVLCILRKTYGYQKKVDYIANSQLVEATGLCKAVISRVLHSLEDMNVITRRGKHLGVQKNWELWGKLAVQQTIGTKLAEQSTTEELAISSQELAISSQELAEQSTKVSSPRVTQKKKETIQKKLYKRKYGEFENVLLTDKEHQKLIVLFGDKGMKARIETLSRGIASKGYKYQSHYATILTWERRDNNSPAAKGGKTLPDTETLKEAWK